MFNDCKYTEQEENDDVKNQIGIPNYKRTVGRFEVDHFHFLHNFNIPRILHFQY